MKAKIRGKNYILLGYMIIVVLLSTIVANIYHESQPAGKQIVEGHAVWQKYDLDAATNDAASIVHGRVVEKSETFINEYDEPYRNVTIEVINTLKGTDSSEMFTYVEMGGETDTHIYKTEGFEDVKADEEYILFLNKHGAILSPSTRLPVNNGVVSAENEMLPEGQSRNANATTMDINEYVESIKNQLSTK